MVESLFFILFLVVSIVYFSIGIHDVVEFEKKHYNPLFGYDWTIAFIFIVCWVGFTILLLIEIQNLIGGTL